MTGCERVHATLTELLEETEPLPAHVASCANCNILLSTLRETMRIYRELQPLPLPAAVHARLEDLLRRVRREAEEA